MNKKILLNTLKIAAILGLSVYLIYSFTNSEQSPLGEVPENEENFVLGVASTTDLIVNNQISGIVENADGTYNINYIYTIKNIGASLIYNINAINNLQNAFSPYTFKIESIQSDKLHLTSSFDGRNNTSILTGVDSLAAGKEAKIFITINLESNNDTGPFENFVEVSGLIEGPEDESKENDNESNQGNTGNESNNNTTPTPTQQPGNDSNNNNGNNGNGNSNGNNGNNNQDNTPKKPNVAPKMEKCPEYYKEVVKGVGKLSSKKNESKISIPVTFPAENYGKFKLALATKEGNPDNKNCMAKGSGAVKDDRCEENEDFESYSVKLSDQEIFKYIDHKNPEKQNWWFKNWTTKKITDKSKLDHTLSFEHLKLGTGDQALHFKYLLCIQTEPEPVKPTNTPTPTVVPTQAEQENNNSGDGNDSESNEEESEQFDSAAYNSASAIFTLLKKIIDSSTGNVDGEATVDDEVTTPSPTEEESNEGEVISENIEPKPGQIIYTAVTTNSHSDNIEKIEGVVLGGATTNVPSIGNNNSGVLGSLTDTGLNLGNISLIGLFIIILTSIINLILSKTTLTNLWRR